MRALISKIATGSMVAGAALLVAACGGGGGAEANNTAMTEVDAGDTTLDGTTNDVTAIDAGTGMDANMSMDMNTTMDANMTNTGGAAGAEMNATTNGM